MTPFTDRTGRFSWLKTLSFAGFTLPALWIGWLALHDALGPLPIKEALHLAGLWAMRFLLVSLALTPAQRLLRWPRLALIRRMTGLAAACYVALHIALFFAMEHLGLLLVLRELVLRRYLQIGLVAALGIAVLAATSNEMSQRRLGARWHRLHRLSYGIAALGLLHFFMQSKIDVSAAVLLAGFYLLLMAWRVVLRLRPPAPVLPVAIAGCGAALATALVEALWYGLASGLSPWRVLAANFGFAHGLRPAVAILAVGLVGAILVLFREARTAAPRPAVRPAE